MNCKQENVTLSVCDIVSEGRVMAALSNMSVQESLIPNRTYTYTFAADGREYKCATTNQQFNPGETATALIHADGKAELMFDAVTPNRIVLSEKIITNGQPVNELRDIPLISKKAFGGTKKRVKALKKGGTGKAVQALVLKRIVSGQAEVMGKTTVYCKLLLLIGDGGKYFLTWTKASLPLSRRDPNEFTRIGANTCAGSVVGILYDPENPAANILQVLDNGSQY